MIAIEYGRVSHAFFADRKKKTVRIAPDRLILAIETDIERWMRSRLKVGGCS